MHAAAQANLIDKHDCNQLNGSMNWFSAQYDKTCSATPVMVHPKIVPEHAATLHVDTRIIKEGLARLIEALRSYSVGISIKSS
jgi:hypothetical protein